MAMWLRACTVFFLLATAAECAEPTKYVIVSQPSMQKIVYAKVPDNPANFRGTPRVEDLITEELQDPRGIAVDQVTNRLFIADPMAKRIITYQLAFKDGKVVVDGEQGTAAQDVVARWVAVDGVGNVFFTNGQDNLIQKVLADRIALDDYRPETMYKGEQVYQVSKPSGIGVDNFHVFWANRDAGLTMGSLNMGMENPPDTNVASSVRVMARNSLMSTGVCLSATNVFYTGQDRFVYVVKKTGGKPVTVTDKLSRPRGCVWDGDGTIYAADQGNNAVYSFGASMHDLTAERVHKAFHVHKPFGVAVLSSSACSLTPLFYAAMVIMIALTFGSA